LSNDYAGAQKSCSFGFKDGLGWETRDGVESEWGRNDAIYAIYFPLFFLTNPRRRRAEAAKNLRVVGKHETAGKAKEKLNLDAFGLVCFEDKI
jgi:hypothetical protein